MIFDLVGVALVVFAAYASGAELWRLSFKVRGRKRVYYPTWKQPVRAVLVGVVCWVLFAVALVHDAWPWRREQWIEWR